MAMRHGLAYEEMKDSLQRALIECVAKNEAYGSADPSVARLAILTGIPRQDVARLKPMAADGAAEELTRLNRIGRIIVGWYRDFIGPYGIPLELPLEPGEKSFPDLVRRYAGQVDPLEVLEELRMIGVIEETADSKVRLATRSYITGRLRPESIERMSWAVHDLAATLDHNLDPKRDGPALFERRVFTPEPIEGALLDAFKQLATDEGQAFLEKLDNWLNEQFQEIRKKRRRSGETPIAPTPDAKRVGVGVYWFERKELGA